ncbi:MAG: family 10 glycosylhydrolase [Bacteroidales bacterium]|nr:family 10 glycosylhydrolase [Bacteroidales bacterium]
MKLKLTLLSLICGFTLLAQENNSLPKNEMRGVWIATVDNIDWPSQMGLSIKNQKNEYIELLDSLVKVNMNTIIFQVRPQGDAFYKSSFEPWSEYIMGKQGQTPSDNTESYDPLQFLIEEAHRRGIEFHAWLNPYRISIYTDIEDKFDPNHIYFKHPEWFVKYGERYYFNPGVKESKEFVLKVVKEIVADYDIDAIHFDDYFYPYQIKGTPFPDSLQYAKYTAQFNSNEFLKIDDWRRENVNIMVKDVYNTIKETKPWVKFGISPFGVWRNIADDPRGSNTTAGTTNYDQLYADVIKWQENGWIDYLLPQLYWQIGHPTVDFDLLANWWANHSYSRGMYIGHGIYKIDSSSVTKEWTMPGELPKQINLLRAIPEINGSAFYSSNHFNRNLMGLQDSLKLSLNRKPAIIPPMKWIDNTPPQKVVKFKKRGKKIKWKVDEFLNEMDKPKQFVIYINEQGLKFNSENSNYIYKITGNKEFKFSKFNKKKKKYEVRVSVLDRLHNESEISKPVILKL